MKTIDGVLRGDAVPQEDGQPTEGGGSIEAGTLFLDLSRRVFNYAYYHTRDPESADDIVSAVFEKVHRSRTKFDPAKAGAADWVFAIAANTVRDHFRARKRSRFVSMEGLEDPPSTAESPEDRLVRMERAEEPLQGISRLERREREIIAMKFAGGLSNKAIARICGIRANTAAVIVHRAVRKLRVELRKGEEGI
jgi:RNA polymerase sigma-70 factor, ECF subfamily